MGKKSRMRRERRKRREKMAPMVEKWSQIPEGALSGPCREPSCTLPHCMDPWATVVTLRNEQHDGPLVMVCYSVGLPDGSDERRLRVNGEDIAVIPKGKLFRTDPAAHKAATNQLIELMHDRFGAGAPLALVQHLAKGRDLNQTHHGRKAEA